jgi:signal peptidase II
LRSSLFTIIGILFLDQFIKIWIKTSYALHSEIGSLGFIKFQFIENPGMAFGLTIGGEDAVWGKLSLSIFRLIAVVFIGFYIRRLIRTKANKYFIICISLIFAGALGNILDSAFYGILFSESMYYSIGDGISQFLPEGGGYAPFMMGKVVDMIHFQFYWPEFMPFALGGNEVFPPIFNIADASISTAFFIIIIFYKKIVRDQDFKFSNKKIV